MKQIYIIRSKCLNATFRRPQIWTCLAIGISVFVYTRSGPSARRLETSRTSSVLGGQAGEKQITGIKVAVRDWRQRVVDLLRGTGQFWQCSSFNYRRRLSVSFLQTVKQTDKGEEKIRKHQHPLRQWCPFQGGNHLCVLNRKQEAAIKRKQGGRCLPFFFVMFPQKEVENKKIKKIHL